MWTEVTITDRYMYRTDFTYTKKCVKTNKHFVYIIDILIYTFNRMDQ